MSTTLEERQKRRREAVAEIERERQAAYSQGYKDAREASSKEADYYASNSATARSIKKAILALPIPEAK